MFFKTKRSRKERRREKENEPVSKAYHEMGGQCYPIVPSRGGKSAPTATSHPPRHLFLHFFRSRFQTISVNARATCARTFGLQVE